LSTHLREREERIQQVLQCLIQESAKGIPIVVEGKKDVQTLKHLGVCGKIVTAKTGGKSQLDLLCQIEESGAKEVILLFDFDRRGKEWTETIRQRLEISKTRPNLTCWNELLGLVGKEVKDVEGLASYVETLQKKTGQAVF
jgi:2,5-diamino-6-(ribosylamino)-4(3H)-pyrimidinone 5'-phosphate reductase